MFKKSFKRNFIFLVLTVFYASQALGQNLQVGLPFLQERIRIKQLEGAWDPNVSLLVRPLDLGDYSTHLEFTQRQDTTFNIAFQQKGLAKNKKIEVQPLPLVSLTGITLGNPYGHTSNLLINKGFQNYLTGGIFLRKGILSIQIQPEYIF
ncbi:MAG: hypothetical protein LPJ98_01485, partial [Cyclobacteriaceae bacterium]|nr:hypothetical protein [Cyclobacteriaceae bacterium]